MLARPLSATPYSRLARPALVNSLASPTDPTLYTRPAPPVPTRAYTMAAEGNSRVDLIRTLNKLQDTFSAIGGETVDLPQIVVV